MWITWQTAKMLRKERRRAQLVKMNQKFFKQKALERSFFLQQLERNQKERKASHHLYKKSHKKRSFLVPKSQSQAMMLWHQSLGRMKWKAYLKQRRKVLRRNQRSSLFMRWQAPMRNPQRENSGPGKTKMNHLVTWVFSSTSTLKSPCLLLMLHNRNVSCSPWLPGNAMMCTKSLSFIKCVQGLEPRLKTTWQQCACPSKLKQECQNLAELTAYWVT